MIEGEEGAPISVRHGLVALLAGGASTAAILLGVRSFLLSHGYEPAMAVELALVISTFAALLWLPLLGAAFVAGGGFRESIAGLMLTALAWTGGVIAGGGGALMLGGPLWSWLWGQAMVLVVTGMLHGIGWAPLPLGRSAMARRARVVLVLLFLLSNPFLGRAAMGVLRPGSGRDLIEKLAIWLSPLACISTTYAEFDYVTSLPSVYEMWGGPQALYPPSPWCVIGAYGGLAVVFWTLSWLGRGVAPVGSDLLLSERSP